LESGIQSTETPGTLPQRRKEHTPIPEYAWPFSGGLSLPPFSITICDRVKILILNELILIYLYTSIRPQLQAQIIL
jgi:hypothetical protein